MAEEALILAVLQRLRRYARLLTGDQRAADDAVAKALVSAFKQPFAGRDDLKPHLFEHFSYVWTPSSAHASVAKQVFLLTALERFSDDEIRRVLGLSEAQLREARSRSAGECGACDESQYPPLATRRQASVSPADRDQSGWRVQ